MILYSAGSIHGGNLANAPLHQAYLLSAAASAGEFRLGGLSAAAGWRAGFRELYGHESLTCHGRHVFCAQGMPLRAEYMWDRLRWPLIFSNSRIVNTLRALLELGDFDLLPFRLDGFEKKVFFSRNHEYSVVDYSYWRKLCMKIHR